MKRRVLLGIVMVTSLAALVLAGCTPPADTGAPGDTTTITADITTATTWETGKVYTVDGSINVAAKLTIQPGTTIKFTTISNWGAALVVTTAGQIVSEGTADNPIVFTSAKVGSGTAPAAGDWAGIEVHGSSSSFAYCTFMYAGNGDAAALSVETSNVSVTNCTFASNVIALSASEATANTTISGNVFYGNTGGASGYWPVYINTNVALDNTNLFTNADGSVKNTNQGIGLVGNVSVAMTLANARVPYIIEGTPVVSTKLTINPSVTLKFTHVSNWGAGITVAASGQLLADGGAATTPITFTAIKDGSDMAPALGDWAGIVLNDAANACVFNYCTFKYSGNGNYAALSLGATSSTTVTNSTFTHNYLGIDRSLVTGGTFTGNTFSLNTTDELVPVP
jgi:hypothetical protein